MEGPVPPITELLSRPAPNEAMMAHRSALTPWRRQVPLTLLVAVLSWSAIATSAQSIPQNATRRDAGWVCNEGYVKRSTSCVPVAKATDEELRGLLVDRSIAAYSGSCPCPFNLDRAGHRCGARSAYRKPGGAAPLCYATDVTQKMVEDYRKKWK
jgi:hypothetical protein